MSYFSRRSFLAGVGVGEGNCCTQDFYLKQIKSYSGFESKNLQEQHMQSMRNVLEYFED